MRTKKENQKRECLVRKKKNIQYTNLIQHTIISIYISHPIKKKFNTGEWNSGLEIWRKRIKKIQDKLGQKRLTEGREKEKKSEYKRRWRREQRFRKEEKEDKKIKKGIKNKKFKDQAQ